MDFYESVSRRDGRPQSALLLSLCGSPRCADGGKISLGFGDFNNSILRRDCGFHALDLFSAFLLGQRALLS